MTDPIVFKHAQHKFHAVRDRYGIPHIKASSWREALYALGYLHAIDRPTQMRFAWAVARGRGAELIADTPELLETDRFFRRAGLFLNLKREIALLDDHLFDQVTFYCQGVNDGMKDSGRSLPMWATGFHPRPWNQQSVLLIGNLLSYAGLAVSQQQNERLLVELIQLGIDPGRLQELFAPSLDSVDFALLKRVKISSQLSNESLELISDLPRLAGSNAWAVSPQRSHSGHALLASDPHLEVNRLPAIWYEVVLQWPDGYVMGATLPGCPLFAVARTAQLAWGVTHMKGDTMDYFIEDCRRGGSTGWQFRRGKDWYDFSLREEIIYHKGKESEILPVYENEQGTLESDPESGGAGLYLSVAWVGNQEGTGCSIGSSLQLITSGSTAEAMNFIRRSPHPSLVWVFADKQGHIGKQASGWFPKRPQKNSGLLPVSAWDERNHWQGLMDPELLPREYDPPEGFVVAANENMNDPEGPKWTTLVLPDYRYRRIVEQLAVLPKASIKEMCALQYDVVSLHARDLLPIFLPYISPGKIKDRLLSWNYAYTPDCTEAALFQQLYHNVLLEIFGHEKGIGWRRMLYLCTRQGYSTMVLTSIDHLLHKEKSGWWKTRDKGKLIRNAADRLSDDTLQPWSKTNKFHFVNRFFEGRRVGQMLGFHTAEVAMPGCHATPFQGHLLRTATRQTSFAPSYHFVADLGTDEAWTNLPGGPSESRFSKYYKNDIERWASGRYKTLRKEPHLRNS